MQRPPPRPQAGPQHTAQVVMNTQTPHFNYQWRDPRGAYFLGPQENAFLDQPLPPVNEEARNYGMQAVKQQQQRNREIVDGPIPRQMHVSRQPEVEDISIYRSMKDVQEAVNQEPVYKVFRFLVNSKYSETATQPVSALRWVLGPSISPGTSGTILVNEDYFAGVVAVAVQPFEVPSTLFSATDTYFGTVMMRLDSLAAPDLGVSEYYGAPNQVATSRFSFSFVVSASVQAGRSVLTPVQPLIYFPQPVTIGQSRWGISFLSPFNQTLTLQPPLLNGVTAAPANPLVIIAPNHGLATGNDITIETMGLDMTYSASNTFYAVTVIDANTFSVPINGTLVAAGTAILVCAVARVVHAVFEIRSLDKEGKLGNSTRAQVTIGN